MEFDVRSLHSVARLSRSRLEFDADRLGPIGLSISPPTPAALEITPEGIGGVVGEGTSGSPTSNQQSWGVPNQGTTLRHLRVHGKVFVEGVEYALEPRQQALLLALMDDLDHEMDKEALKNACASQGQRFTPSKVFDRIPMVYKTFVRYLSLDGRYQLLVPEQDRSWLR